MSKYSILLCCGAGMSSGFLAQRARAAAKKRELDMSIEARSHTDIASYMSSIDILMIGPHYANEKSTFDELASGYNVPVIVIPQDVYSQLKGDALIDIAFEEINKK